MTIEDMHYDFRVMLNKIDSQSGRTLYVPEIDWLLNEAQEIFVKNIAEPRNPNSPLGVETSQRTLEDIRSIIEEGVEIVPTDNIATLPSNYWFFLRGRAIMVKGNQISEGVLYRRQHDDMFEESPFDCSSFEWRTVNAVFNKDGIKLFTGDFTVSKLSISYVRKLSYIHNAQKFTGGQYKLPDGVTILTNKKDCELPSHTHREIVDIAVMLASGNLTLPDYNIKREKLSTINQFI